MKPAATETEVTRMPAARPADTSPPRLTPAVLRLVVTALLFLGWIGYLGYLVLTLPTGPHKEPLLLSRPQFLLSELDVVARVDSLTGPVVVEQVVYPAGGPAQSLVGATIVVTNLRECRPLPLHFEEQRMPDDFTGPGRYILALRPTAVMPAARTFGLLASPQPNSLLAVAGTPWPELEQAGVYEVVPTPASPGFPPRGAGRRVGPPRIYPATPQTLAQLRHVPKPG
jgi:hypothetical protein